MRASPTQRSLKLLRGNGYLAEKVEQRLPIPGKFITRDLFNCIDIVAVHGEKKEILGVQTTTRTNMTARLEKAKLSDGLRHWLDAGGTFEIHGWKKVGPRGKRKLWKCDVIRW